MQPINSGGLEMKQTSVMLVLSICILLLPAAEAQVPDNCAKLNDLRIPGTDLQITSTKSLSAAPMPKSPMGGSYQGTVPAHCRVDGVLESRNGVNNTPYGIGFAIALPVDWNGRFLFQGGGGLNGAVQTPLGAQVSGDAPALAKGFAIVSTDSGHKGSGFDAKFFADQEAALNFLYLAVGKVTVVAKQIVASYYGRPIEHSFFVGCSTGGREAMIVSQRYPRYFNGVISGAPAMRTGFSNLGMRWVSVALSQAAADDKTRTTILITSSMRVCPNQGHAF
jgi:hypothetical protein